MTVEAKPHVPLPPRFVALYEMLMRAAGAKATAPPPYVVRGLSLTADPFGIKVIVERDDDVPFVAHLQLRRRVDGLL